MYASWFNQILIIIGKRVEFVFVFFSDHLYQTDYCLNDITTYFNQLSQNNLHLITTVLGRYLCRLETLKTPIMCKLEITDDIANYIDKNVFNYSFSTWKFSACSVPVCTMYDFHDSTDTLKFWTEKRAINKTFLFFIWFWWNLVKL